MPPHTQLLDDLTAEVNCPISDQPRVTGFSPVIIDERNETSRQINVKPANGSRPAGED